MRGKNRAAKRIAGFESRAALESAAIFFAKICFSALQNGDYRERISLILLGRAARPPFFSASSRRSIFAKSGQPAAFFALSAPLLKGTLLLFDSF